jgi:hypothetical protein
VEEPSTASQSDLWRLLDLFQGAAHAEVVGGPARISHVPFCLYRDVASDRAGGIEHVCTHSTGRLIAIALSDGVQNGLMLLAGASKPACVTQLGATESFHSVADGQRLLRHECVVGRTVDGFVKLAIEFVIAVDVAPLDQRLRCIMHFDELATLKRSYSVGGNPDAHCLDFGRGFEHFHDPFRRGPGNDDAAPGSDLDQASDGKLPKRLSDGRSRRAEPVGEILFIQAHAGRKRARCDFVGQNISYLIGEKLWLPSANR